MAQMHGMWHGNQRGKPGGQPMERGGGQPQQMHPQQMAQQVVPFAPSKAASHKAVVCLTGSIPPSAGTGPGPARRHPNLYGPTVRIHN